MEPDHDEFQALRVAEAQRKNLVYQRPLDYGAILKYRQVAPNLFEGLPTDAECRHNLSKDKQQKH